MDEHEQAMNEERRRHALDNARISSRPSSNKAAPAINECGNYMNPITPGRAMSLDDHYAQQGTASRESARALLHRRAAEFEEKARRLRLLSEALPLVLPFEADQLLYDLLQAPLR